MRGQWIRRRDGRAYQDWRYGPDNLTRDVAEWHITPEQAHLRIIRIRKLVEKLLDPNLSDTRRCAIVNMLHRRLAQGHNRIEQLAVLSKIASSPRGRSGTL